MPVEAKEMDNLVNISAKRLKTLDFVQVNATESTSLYFGTPTKDDSGPEQFLSSLTSYQPTFTYPFFGQEEVFKGTAKASLKICFDPISFYAFISFEVDEDAESLKEELLANLTDFLPEGIYLVFYLQCSMVYFRRMDDELERVCGEMLGILGHFGRFG